MLMPASKLEEVILTAPSITLEFTNLPGGYQKLVLELLLRSTKADQEDTFGLLFNGDNAPYHYANEWNFATDDGYPLPLPDGTRLIVASPWAYSNWPNKPNAPPLDSARLAGGMIPGAHADSGCFGIYTVEVPWYDTPGVRRALRGWGGYGQFSGIPNGVGTYLGTRGCGTFFGTWGAEEAVTQLTVQSSTGIFAAGSRGVLYGVL